MGCALCGGAPAVRWEQCYIDEDTKAKLLAHADELNALGLTLEEPGESLRKMRDSSSEPLAWSSKLLRRFVPALFVNLS